MRTSGALCAALALAVALGGCGGGGSAGGSVELSGLAVTNSNLTAGGAANGRHIVGVSYQSVHGGPLMVCPPMDVPPGASAVVDVPTGTFNVLVTYDDGSHESLQSPGDPVSVYSGQDRSILFMR